MVRLIRQQYAMLICMYMALLYYLRLYNSIGGVGTALLLDLTNSHAQTFFFFLVCEISGSISASGR